MTLFVITGGIASGKSFVLNFMKSIGCKTLSSDELAKEIMSREDFPIKNPRQTIEEDFTVLDQIETIVHKEIQLIRENWLQDNIKHNYHLAIEIPLFFEKNLAQKLHAYNPIIISTVCGLQRQIQRVKKRPQKPSNELLNFILNRQTNDAERVARSHFIIYTYSKSVAKKQIRKILKIFHERYN